MCGMESERGEDFGDGGTDCHGQCSHWPRNDIGFSWGCGVRRGTWAPPYKGLCEDCGRTGAFAPTALRNEEVRRGGALLPTVVPTGSRPLSWPPIGALPRNRLASSATGGASAISPPAGGVEPRPYGSATRGAMGGRPQGSPLRKRCKGCVGESGIPQARLRRASPL